MYFTFRLTGNISCRDWSFCEGCGLNKFLKNTCFVLLTDKGGKIRKTKERTLFSSFKSQRQMSLKAFERAYKYEGLDTCLHRKERGLGRL